MEEDKKTNLEKAEKELETLKKIEEFMIILQEDQRFIEYQKLLKLFNDGEVIQTKLEQYQKLYTMHKAKLDKYSNEDKAVRTRVYEEQSDEIPESKKRTDEQLKDGHYLEGQEEVKPYIEKKEEPVKQTNPNQRQVTPEEIEKQNQAPDLDDLNADLDLNMNDFEEEDDS